MSEPSLTIEGYAIWHPVHGFRIPFHFEGPLAYVRPDDAVEDVRELNKADGADTRKGWRIVPVQIVRVPA